MAYNGIPDQDVRRLVGPFNDHAGEIIPAPLLRYTGEPARVFMPPICLTCVGQGYIGDGGYIECPTCGGKGQ